VKENYTCPGYTCMRLWPKDLLLALLLGAFFWFSFIATDAIIFYSGLSGILLPLEIPLKVPLEIFLMLGFAGIYFKQVREHEHFVAESIFLGLFWLILMGLLDFLFLAPLFELSTETYFLRVGWEYLSIPLVLMSFGFVVHHTSLQDYF
jgi:hypothetical protein